MFLPYGTIISTIWQNVNKVWTQALRFSVAFSIPKRSLVNGWPPQKWAPRLPFAADIASALFQEGMKPREKRAKELKQQRPPSKSNAEAQVLTVDFEVPTKRKKAEITMAVDGTNALASETKTQENFAQLTDRQAPPADLDKPGPVPTREEAGARSTIKAAPSLQDALARKIGIVTWIRGMIEAGKTNDEIIPGYKQLLMKVTGYDEQKANVKARGNLTYYRTYFTDAKPVRKPASEQPAQQTIQAQIDREKILQSVVSIIEAESPIHQDVLAHRVARQLGFFKAGARIRASVWKMAKARFKTTKEEVGLFFWKADGEAGRCSSCRPGSDGNPRYVHEVAMPELVALAKSIIKGSDGDIRLPVGVIPMARHLGLRRLRDASRPRLEKAWKKALREQV